MKLDADKVRWHRDSRGWTLETAAEQAEVALGTVLRAEHGEDIRPSSGRRIARAFGVDVSELVPDKPGVLVHPLAEAPSKSGQPEKTTGEFQQALERVLEYPREDVRLDEQAATRALASEGVPQTRIADAPEVVAARKFREEFAPGELPMAAGELAVGYAQYERENTNLRAALQERRQRIAQLEEENARLREEVAKLHEQVASVE